MSEQGEGSPPKKISKMGESTCQGPAEFDTETQKFLDELNSLQHEIDDINEKASEEIMQVEEKYNRQRKPLFELRNNTIDSIPHFWITAMMNHPDLSMVPTEAEQDCLQHLSKLEVEEFEDIRSGYRIKFHFEENPYFENAVLIKEFQLEPDNPISVSTPIEWKEGCSLAQGSQESHDSPPKCKKRRFDSTSFFSWFNDNVDPSTDDIAEVVKDDLWINPLQYYLVPDVEEENPAEGDESDNSEGEGGDTSAAKGAGDAPSTSS